MDSIEAAQSASKAAALKLKAGQRAVPNGTEEGSASSMPQPHLSEHQSAVAMRLIEEGDPEGFVNILKENGVPVSTQVELARHFTKELEESIRLIAWTKKRLMYTTAILEHTLNSANKNVTSAENLIQNYLIFNRIFEEGESKLPRFGQFEYVMRSIFKGVTTKDEIYKRIANHKTFGEGVPIDRSAIDALSQEVERIGKDIRQQFEASQEKKQALDSALQEAREEEEQSKGTTWTTSFSQPKEYRFPNYTFQTGPRKGLNHAPGRSSWEPMFLAYADVVNKRMADRISAKTDLSDEERRRRIAGQRIELLYEQFQFPVDIKSVNGTDRPVVYILDFIDINRWRAIEVKGPLTPKGAEKIRLFQKYYVEGDFSDLPEEKKIVMMRYVQDKKDEIADWCKERGYPVFDHFSSLNVLGAHKWDHDLNNFNRYDGAKDMTGLSAREKDQLQKGFFKLVEDRIATGKTPDIRPELYTDCNHLPSVIKSNKKTAGVQHMPYEVEESFSTRPYIPERIIEEAIRNFRKSNDVHFDHISAAIVAETLPISPYNRELLVTLTWLSDVLFKFDRTVYVGIQNLTPTKHHLIESGGDNKTLSIQGISRVAIDKMLIGLDMLSGYIHGLKKTGALTSVPKFDEKVARAYIKKRSSLYRKNITTIDSNQYFTIDKDCLATFGEEPDYILATTIELSRQFILGEYKTLYDRRINAVNKSASNILNDDPGTIEEMRKSLDTFKDGRFVVHVSSLFNSIGQLSLSEEKVQRASELLSLLLTANGLSEITPDSILNMMLLIEKRFQNLEKAAQHFASLDKSSGSTQDKYLEMLEALNLSLSAVTPAYNRPDFMDYLTINKDSFITMSEILLQDELGKEKYDQLISRFRANFETYAGQWYNHDEATKHRHL